MVIVDLSSTTMTLMLLRKDVQKTERITIERGRHKDRLYHRAVIVNGSVILEGDGEPLLLTKAEAVYAKSEDIRDKIAAILSSDDIYMQGMAAIPEGQERNLLKGLLG